MTTLADLSVELVDRILFALDPLDIARVSCVSRFFHDIVYGPLHRQFWRGLYLAQPLDDPRRTMTRLGSPRDNVDWKGELQRIIRARTVVTHPTVCRQEERRQVLHTCIDLITHLPPIPFPHGAGETSCNVRWMQHLLGDGAFFEHEMWEALEGEEEQLLSRLHALYGLIRRDLDPEQRRASQAFVYSLRHRTAERAFGPFMPDGSMRVDWTFMWTLVHDLGMLLMDTDGSGGNDSCLSPLSIFFAQSVIPCGLDIDKEDDWAWVEGLWSVRYAFIDHREFILYNDPSVPDHEPQDTTIFDGAEETLSSMDVYFRVASIEPDPAHTTRPKINVIGEVDGKFSLMGFIKLTNDDQLWFHLDAGNDNQMVWSGDAIGLGNVRSRCGFVGVWSTVFHDTEDPIGPFWLQRLFLEEDE